MTIHGTSMAVVVESHIGLDDIVEDQASSVAQGRGEGGGILPM